MILTTRELQDPVWLKIKAHLEARLTDLRKQNDADLSPDATAKLRGRILETRKTLDLGNPRPEIEE